MSSRILVDEVYGKTANTSALTIDSSGNVTIPQRLSITTIPYAFATFPDTGNYVSKTQNSILDFSNAVVNDGNHYNTSTYKFTCPVAGLYSVQYSTFTQNSGDAYSVFVVRNTGGTETKVARIFTQSRSLAGAMTVKCSANDDLYLVTNSTYNFYQSVTNPYNWVMYRFIG